MVDRAQHRRQKKREKQRRRSKERARRMRSKRRVSKVRSLSRLAALPVGECYISEHWHEQGPTIIAALTRQHRNGQLAVCLLHIDLAERGILSAEVTPEVDPERLLSFLGQRAGEEALVECEPELVVHAATVGAALGAVSAYAAVTAMFADIDPADCPHEILTGTAPPPRVEERKPGLTERLGTWLSRRKQ